MTRQWAKLSDVSQRKLTPMLRQYLEAKTESGDSLLFFRMGDFYEMFFEDAVEASQLLGLTLTSRDGLEKDDRVPMAGVPVRAVDGYIARIIKAGRTVTICEQMEDPKDAKGIVKRAVVRTITPGTVIEPALLEDAVNNYLAAFCMTGAKAGLAFVDVTTGEFLVAQIDGDCERIIADELMRMAPPEVLFAPGPSADLAARLRAWFDGTSFVERDVEEFNVVQAREQLLDEFEITTLKGIELDTAPEALACAGAVLGYVKSTQHDAVPHLRLPRRYNPAHYVVLDGNTQRNLELVETAGQKGKRGTLLSVLDRTQTSMGARKLRQWILHPLIDVREIRSRLDAVEELFNATEARLRLREALRTVGDLERLMGRITARAANARDIKALAASLDPIPSLRGELAAMSAPLLRAIHGAMDELEDVREEISAAIVDEPPATLLEGNLIRDGYNADLDRLHILVRGGKDWIATLQKEESARAGIPIKIGYNKVFGYYIEVTKSHAGRVPQDYERKQTLVGAERYVTPALKAREEEIVAAQERMQRLEYDLFSELRDRIAHEAKRVQDTADAVAALDALLSFADTAAARNYCKPEVDDGDAIAVRDGRHPVVEDLMPRGDFVPNDVAIDPSGAFLQIITGPNMAGKSTYLRQVALITLMAQIGSFVPAAQARIGVVDRIFTRVGASDNLVRGESTFMVEMIETATILNTATPRSLLVLDEIGRGTSTFDGISIAWSVAEYIHDRIRAKTLFATHYHELTNLVNKLDHAKNLNVAVREWAGKVVFLYRILEGGADHSYGIQVAKLAGLPKTVIERARTILQALETGDTAALGLPQQMDLFAPAARPAPLAESSPFEKELDQINPDELSPREAQELVYHLKRLLDASRAR